MSLENKRWIRRIFIAVTIAGMASMGLTLIGIKGSPLLFEAIIQ